MNAFYGGIDFGTSSFMISAYQTHGPKGVLTGLGRRSFPSVVAISRTNELYIGESALPYILSSTYFLIQCAKRVIGYQYNSERVLSNPEICIANMREGRDGKVEFYKEVGK